MALSKDHKNGKANGKGSANAKPYLGLHNLRSATALVIQEEGDYFFIATRLGGMEIHNIDIRLVGGHLIIEGTVMDAHQQPQRGRWVRNLELPAAIDTSYLDAEYTYDGWLHIRVRKR